MNFLGVYGHVNIDQIISLDRLPAVGTSQEVKERTIRLGGPAGNIAVYASSLEVPVSLASYVGDDFPPEFMQKLKTLNIDLTDLVVVDGETTPQVFVFSNPDQEQMYVIDPGVFLNLADRPVLENAVKNSRWVHISTGRPTYFTKVAKLAKEQGKMVALDPGQEIHFVYNEQNLKEIIQYADAFFGNTLEAGIAVDLLGIKGPADLTGFVDFAVVTDGKKGSTIYTKEGPMHHIPAADIKEEGDATGAGDAYRAGFYAGLSRNRGLEECGRIASAAASIVVGRDDPIEHPPSWEEVLQLARVMDELEGVQFVD